MADFLMARGVAARIAWRSTQAVVCGGAPLLAGKIETAPAMVEAYLDFAGIAAKEIFAAEGVGFSAVVAVALDAAMLEARFSAHFP